MTMISAIASSSGCSAPTCIKPSATSTSPLAHKSANFSGFIFCRNRSRSVIIHDSSTDIHMRNTMGVISGARTFTLPEHHVKVKRKKSIEDERKHSFDMEGGKRFDVDGAKHITEKDREAFLSYGLFNIVAGKRTAELLEKQHRHEHVDDGRWGTHAGRRGSEPETLRFSTKHDFLVLPQTKDTTSDKRKAYNEMSATNLEVKPVSEKRSLKRVAKTTSRNLQEFFKKF